MLLQVTENSNCYITVFNTTLNVGILERPFTYFKESIETQRENGVTFVKGEESDKAFREFVKCIAETIRCFMAKMLHKTTSISMEMDAFQAKKNT